MSWWTVFKLDYSRDVGSRVFAKSLCEHVESLVSNVCQLNACFADARSYIATCSVCVYSNYHVYLNKL